ncbi:MAG: hypothetical protein ETSY1_23855 [Candidatus Entotheonella factor]|uniref:Inositol monophosphatase n=1 Tax=Entotheonella factor TaxID=1429438 RepID=W4LIF2_ENTF1|nr:inositol monophosphatase [Candidatus Entotheonella palauensis]ETW97116.1 MAG: hypothetical protein ETSY1_23855 [Candidatus Entotheonella factor]
MKPEFTNGFVDGALAVIRSVLQDVRPRLLQAYGNVDRRYKSDNSEVTELDIYVEEELKKALLGFDGAIGFQGEETGVQGNTQTYWLADPIDGTMMFVRGLPSCTNMIALVDEGRPVLSVIYNFALDEWYQAVAGQGAFLNGQRLRVSATQEVSGAVFAVEVDVRRNNNRDFFAKLWDCGASNLNLVCAGYEFAHVAAGRIAGRITQDAWAAPYDLAPGVLLVEEAGGYVATPDGAPYTVDALNVIACAHERLFDELKGAGLI